MPPGPDLISLFEISGLMMGLDDDGTDARVTWTAEKAGACGGLSRLLLCGHSL